MGILSLTSEQLRYKMKHLDELCPNRSVTNPEEFHSIADKLLKSRNLSGIDFKNINLKYL